MKALKPLDNIKRVDAPPFLYTRILQKIENSQETKISTRQLWQVVLGVLMVIILNVIVLNQSHISFQHNDNNVVTQMNLVQNSQLYQSIP